MPAALWRRSGDRETTNSNRVIAGAKAFFFVSGTTTPLTVYEDNDLSVPHGHPVVANAYGEWPPVYFPPGSYRERITDADDVTLSDEDGIVAPGVPGEGDLEPSSFVATLLPAPDAETFLDLLNVLEPDLITIEKEIGNGISAIETGIVPGDHWIPFGYTIIGAYAFANETGSIVIDIWCDAYANYPPTNGDSITASAPVTITAGIKSQDTSLAGWTTVIAAYRNLRYNVDSNTDIKFCTVVLVARKTGGLSR